jgi:hypothetical protein
MSDSGKTSAPERIWVRESPVLPNRVWHDATNSASTAKMANDCRTINPFVEYRRADLHPTDAQLMADPRVMELVDVSQALASWDQCWPGNVNLEAIARVARDAIARIRAKGGE